MSKRKFNKKPTSIAEQLALLKTRGLIIDDYDKTLRYLNQISYYRLSAYFPPYQKVKDTFNEGVTFKHILDLYRFDRKLRLLVFDSIERIEVTIRAQIVNILCKNHNTSHWHDLKNVFVKPYRDKEGKIVNFYKDFQNIIKKNCNVKNPEVFIKHYKSEYREPDNPPSWMCVELLTIGELSRLYKGLSFNDDRRNIAAFFGLHPTVFESWLHTLTYVRNLCAHHARFWNRVLAIKPEILKKPQRDWVSSDYGNNERVFYLICVLKYLLCAANPNNKLQAKLNTLIEDFPTVPIKFMGMPSDTNGNLLDWHSEPLWN